MATIPISNNWKTITNESLFEFPNRFKNDLIPIEDNRYDIGASTQRWKDFYLAGLAQVGELIVNNNSVFNGNITLGGNNIRVNEDSNLGKAVNLFGLPPLVIETYYGPTGDISLNAIILKYNSTKLFLNPEFDVGLDVNSHNVFDDVFVLQPLYYEQVGPFDPEDPESLLKSLYLDFDSTLGVNGEGLLFVDALNVADEINWRAPLNYIAQDPMDPSTRQAILEYDTELLALDGSKLTIDTLGLTLALNWNLPIEVDPETGAITINPDDLAKTFLIYSPLFVDGDGAFRLGYNNDFELSETSDLQLKIKNPQSVLFYQVSPTFSDGTINAHPDFLFLDNSETDDTQSRLYVPRLWIGGSEALDDTAYIKGVSNSLKITASEEIKIVRDVADGSVADRDIVIDNNHGNMLIQTGRPIDDPQDSNIKIRCNTYVGSSDAQMAAEATAGGALATVSSSTIAGVAFTTISSTSVVGTALTTIQATGALGGSGIVIEALGTVLPPTIRIATDCPATLTGDSGNLLIQSFGTGAGNIDITAIATLGGSINLSTVGVSAVGGGINLTSFCNGVDIDGDINLTATGTLTASINLTCLSTAGGSINLSTASLASLGGGINITSFRNGLDIDGDINISATGTLAASIKIFAVAPDGQVDIAANGNATLRYTGAPQGRLELGGVNIVNFLENLANTGQQWVVNCKYVNGTSYPGSSAPFIGLITNGDLSGSWNSNGTLDYPEALGILGIASDTKILLSTNHGSIALDSNSNIILQAGGTIEIETGGGFTIDTNDSPLNLFANEGQITIRTMDVLVLQADEKIEIKSRTWFSGLGSDTPNQATIWVAPTFTDSFSDYLYYTYFAQPIYSSIDADIIATYTVFIEDAPKRLSGFVDDLFESYALYVKDGTSYFGKTIRANGQGSDQYWNCVFSSVPKTTDLDDADPLTLPNEFTYFNYFGRPECILLDIVNPAGEAYTVFIEGAPYLSSSGLILNPFALYVKTGATYLGGSLNVIDFSLFNETVTIRGGGSSNEVDCSLFCNPTPTAIGSNTHSYFTYFNQPSCTTSGTAENAYTIFIENGPVVSSGGGAITRSYALYVDLGETRLYDLSCGRNLVVSGTSLFADSVAIQGEGNASFVNSALYVNPLTTTVGTNPETFFTYFTAPICSTAGTATSAYTIYIDGAPAVIGGGAITFKYALYVNSGLTRLSATQIGSTLDVSGATTFGTSTPLTISAAGALVVNNTTASTSTTTGCARFLGGIGVSGSVRSGSLATSTTIAAGSTISAVDSITTTSTTNGFKQGTGFPTTSAVNFLSSTTEIGALLTCTNGLTVSSGSTSVQTITAAGLISGSAGLSITSGTTSLQALQVANSTTSYFGSSTGASVGINTSSPQRSLHIVGGLARIDREVSQGSGGGCYFVSLNSGAIVGAWSIQSGTSTSTPNFTIAYTNAAAGGGATITPITVTTAGLTTLTSLTVSGSSTVQNLTVNGTLTYSGTLTTGGSASFSSLSSSGATTLATSSGTTTIGSSTAAQFSAAGALTLQNRLTINSGGVAGSTNTGIRIDGNSSTTRTTWDQLNENGPHIYEVVAGDLTLRSFWGVSVNLNSAAINPSGNAGQARIANTSSFTVNRRAVGGGSGVYDNVFSVNGISGLTSAQSLSSSGTTTLSSTSGTCTIGSSTSLSVSASGVVTVQNTTESSSTVTGALLCKGGMVVEKNLRCLGLTLPENLLTNSSTTSIGSTTGITLTIASRLKPWVLIRRTGQDPGQTDTLPTASDINNAYISGFVFVYKNDSVNSITITAGSGTSFFENGSTSASSVITVNSGVLKIFFVANGSGIMFVL